MYVLVSFLTFVALVLALVDIITRDEWQVKHLPKLVWVLLVVFLPLVGSILWFAVGREYEHRPRIDRGSFGDPRRHETLTPTRHAGGDHRTTEQQLADLDAEIELHERQATLRRLQAELEERRRDA
ncbi:PLDc N-terminal domain-containing protein [Frigoribacterium sp. 2-23]|uniref:PLDc N-terminal domain-containing protein n=1 Tax=Frigoribacterium sp. 2-23 TaxID=3415006 RepID=UPI003C6F698E